MDARAAAIGGVAARVHDEAVQPRRELRVAAELRQPDAHLGERFLRRVTRIFGIAQHVAREALHPRPVARAQSLERGAIARLRPRDEDRVAQLFVDGGCLPAQRLRDGLHGESSLDGRVGPFARARHPVVTWTARASVPLRRRVPVDATRDRRGRARGRDSLDRPSDRGQGPARPTSGRTRRGARRSSPCCCDRPRKWSAGPSCRSSPARRSRRRSARARSVSHPNDVMIDGRKVAGVLPEATSGRIVLGIGVNVNQRADELPADAAKPPTSLYVELGHEVERAPLLAAILARARARVRRLARRILRAMRALLVVLAALILAGAAGAATQPRVLAIQFGPDLEINPVTQDYLTHELSRAASDHYDAVVILLDTPGGLSTSMKTIYNAELNAKLPVIVYVSPERFARRVCGRVGVGGRGRARNGADDEHRLVDADRLERGQPRLRPAAQGDQRLGRVTDRARGDASPQHDLAGEGGARRLQPHGAAGAEDARHRPDRADAARAAQPA